VKDWRRSEVILLGPSRPAKWTSRLASKSSRPTRRRFFEVVIVSKSYTKLCVGVWECDQTRKETKKRHSRARRLHNNSSIPWHSSILCSICLWV